MTNLSSIIIPVLQDMEESYLKDQLLKFLPNQEEAFSKIEKSFKQLTSKVQDKERLQLFFTVGAKPITAP